MTKMNVIPSTYTATKFFFYFIIFAIYSAVFFYSYHTTELPSYEKIPLMDGNQYLKIWHYFNDGNTLEYKVDFPFNGRVLYIWTASFFPESVGPFQAFIILNYCFGLATLFVLFYTWNKLSLSIPLSLFLCGYLCLHWSGIIRQYMIDPIGVDIPYLFFLTLFLNTILFKKYKYLFVIAILGTAVKEAMIPFVLGLFLITLYQKKIIFLENKKVKSDLSKIDTDVKYIFAALLGSVICKILIGRFFPSIQTGWNQNSVVMVAFYFYQIIKDPDHLFNWLAGIALFFGPMIYPFIKGMFHKKYTTGVNGELLLLSLLGILLGILGGGDHTRIVFLTFPLFFTYVLLYWKDTPKSFPWVFYLLPSLYLTKCWLSMPTPTVNWELFSYWYPEYSSYKLFFYELLIVIISLIVLYFYDKMKQRAITH